MKPTLRLASKIAAIAASALWAMPLIAAPANNAASDGGSVGVTLSASGNVTVDTASFQLVKQVYTAAGACLASSPADASCNSSATSVVVPVGTSLKFMIFVRNATDVALSDVRFQDALDETGTGFTYSAGSLKYSNTQADNATIANIYTATNTGTAQTDALGAPDDFASKVGSNITVGAVAGQANQTVSIPARKTFAIIFTASKN